MEPLYWNIDYILWKSTSVIVNLTLKTGTNCLAPAENLAWSRTRLAPCPSDMKLARGETEVRRDWSQSDWSARALGPSRNSPCCRRSGMDILGLYCHHVRTLYYSVTSAVLPVFTLLYSYTPLSLLPATRPSLPRSKVVLSILEGLPDNYDMLDWHIYMHILKIY